MDPEQRQALRMQMSFNLYLDFMKAFARGELRIDPPGEGLLEQRIASWALNVTDDYIDRLEGWVTLDQNVAHGITPNALTRQIQSV